MLAVWIIEIIEVVIEVIVVLCDEVMRLILGLIRTIERSALCQQVFQTTGGHCEAWFVIGAASLSFEDWFVRSYLHCHCVCAGTG